MTIIRIINGKFYVESDDIKEFFMQTAETDGNRIINYSWTKRCVFSSGKNHGINVFRWCGEKIADKLIPTNRWVS